MTVVIRGDSVTSVATCDSEAALGPEGVKSVPAFAGGDRVSSVVRVTLWTLVRGSGVWL